MSIRIAAALAVVALAGGVAGVATSRQTPPSPVAAVQIDLPRGRTDNAALAQARQDPLAARLQGVMRQTPETRAVIAQAATSAVPVLAPADPTLLRTARLHTGDRFYMLTVQRGEQIIEVYGATKAFTPPGGGAAPPARAPATIARRAAAAQVDPAAAAALRRQGPAGLTHLRTEQTEYGTDVTFNRFGATYNVSFICESQGAAGCTPAEAAAFAVSLVLIGGGGS
jgi:hypothetical protein